jgi:hypothetical protein
MTAMPAEKWPVLDPLTEEKIKLDLLILEAAYYRELAYEYPMTSAYRRLLEEAESRLHAAENKVRVRSTV